MSIDDRTSLTDDERIENVVPLPPPEHLIRFFPIQNTPVEKLVAETRRRVREIVRGKSDRLLVIIGPCSIHDPAAALAYAVGWVSGIVFLIFEPNKYVRFHALQSAIAFGGLSLAWMIALSLGPPGWILAIFVIPPVSAVLWLVLMYKAYQGERFKVPIVGDMAEQRV